MTVVAAETELAQPPVAETPTPAVDADTEGTVLADVLVEEISIDGMCGVY